MSLLNRYYWGILGLVLATYGFSLFHAYVGEEANYTIMSMEMWQRQIFRSVVALGSVGGRPPLYNWVMIPVARLVGWSQVLLAARLVTLGATLGTALILGWWARSLWPGTGAGKLAGLLYLMTADVLFYRGWLAYADPLFAFFMVLSAFLLWSAVQRRSLLWLLLSLWVIFASYLTKVVTAYAYFGGIWLVLLSQRSPRAFLCSPRAMGIYVLGLLPMGLWLGTVGHQDPLQVTGQLADVSDKLLSPDALEPWLLKLGEFPLSILVGLLPSSLWVLRGMISQHSRGISWPLPVKILAGMALLNFFPYWIAPHSSPRYVLPEYGLVVLVATYYLIHEPALFQNGILRPERWVVGLVLLGLGVSAVGDPVYQQRVRGDNYARMANQIEALAGPYPIYTLNWSSVGLSVVALIDSRHFDRPAIVSPPSRFTDGLVIAFTPRDLPGNGWAELEGQAEQLMLICRGKVCADPFFHSGRP
ncbi:MAG: hypothetical protein GJU67_03940 [Ferrovum sp.]|jgi:4-amino-4-deoxy-L-arabinose transferase-like glycosyltransferase|nr:hypothetical protein [Ferrovum sp.]